MIPHAGTAAHGFCLDELLRELPQRARIDGDGSVRIDGVQHDSRAIRPGDLFVARKGESADGVRFIPDALARGAAAVMANVGAIEPGSVGVPILWVEDVEAALGYAAAAVYGHPSFSLDVVGITGTNGKTTTSYLVRAAVDGALGRPSCGILGTVGQWFGSWSAPAPHTTPEGDDIARSLAHIRSLGGTHAVLEVSSHGLEMGRVRGVRFRVAAFTNLTQDHLDFHGTMANYGRAKARLFLEFGPGMAVVNVDDAFGLDLASRTRAPTVRVSSRVAARENDADVAPRTARIDAHGIDATVRTPKGDVHIASRLIGAHNLDNLLLALGIAHALDLDVTRAAHALSVAPAPPGRLERCDVDGDDVLVLVDYAHTPDALERVLGALRTIAVPGPSAPRLVCVVGCGGDRDPTKRTVMGAVAARGADVVIVTTDNPRTEDPAVIAAAVEAGARSAGLNPIVELDRHRAIELAIDSARSGDVVLVAGKGHEDYQVVGHVKVPFDDRNEARAALAQRRSRREGA